MSSIPRERALDSTLAIVRDGYNFIWKRCQRMQTDLFRTRVMGMPAVCMHGHEAAEVFYDESKLQRRHALPRRVVTSLFGKHAIHTLDDAAHRQRKTTFMSLMSPASLERLMDITSEEWRRAMHSWEREEAVELFDASARLLTAAVCRWAGVPLDDAEQSKRARDFTSLVDAFGGVGPRLWKGKLARMRTERWIAALIEDVREQRLQPAEDSALFVMANHREQDGTLLPARTAAVELINVLRPTVAISWYVTFAALALHEYPGEREKLLQDTSGEYADLFMQEVRRFYPFTPFLGAMVRRPFDFAGHHFEVGTLVLLDVYGANHDPRMWQDPEQFLPERFRRWSGSAFNFIPQGGGSRTAGHRCPGEWITMHNVTLALHFLTRCVRYDVAPNQDLSIDLRRMPTRPASGLVLRNLRATDALDGPAPRLPSLSARRDGAGADMETRQLEQAAAHH